MTKFEYLIKHIKEDIKNECVSCDDMAYLTAHRQEVLETGDIELCQWAGITEDEYNNNQLKGE